MPFSAQKMHFFDENGNLTPWLARASSDFKKLFFLWYFSIQIPKDYFRKSPAHGETLLWTFSI